MPNEAREIIQTHANNTKEQKGRKPAVIKEKPSTAKSQQEFRIGAAKASLLIGISVMFDLIQTAFIVVNYISEQFSGLKALLDTLVSFAKFIPFVGILIQSLYTTADLALTLMVFLTKIFFVFIVFVLGRFVVGIMFSHFGVTVTERMGWTKEALFHPKIFYLRKLKFVISFMDALIPLWPGITAGTLITIFISRVADKIKKDNSSDII